MDVVDWLRTLAVPQGHAKLTEVALGQLMQNVRVNPPIQIMEQAKASATIGERGKDDFERMFIGRNSLRAYGPLAPAAKKVRSKLCKKKLHRAGCEKVNA